jgi:hypothetical protein
MLSVEEQILELEEHMLITKGPGSKAKKLAIQEEINKLKSSEEETTEIEATPLVKEKPKVEVVNLDIPKGWVKFSKGEALQAEKNGILIGYDSVKGIALIKNHGGYDV